MPETVEFKKDIDLYYDIEEELGSGQFAVVRKIIEKQTGDEYAAKYVRKKRSKASRNGMSREDIQREIEILQLVDHDKIIKVHEVYETDREMVLVMELLRGGELFDYISKKDFLTEEEAIDFTRQILQALQHLHSKNVVHLDLKPENILLKSPRKKIIKLVDFGLARVVKENEQVREIMGTPEFVAPEVLNFDTISTATDMWALGVIAYILLSGASPFLGDDNQETFTNIIQVDYQFDEEYFEEISDEAKDFIKKLLVKDPRKRPTAHECSRHTWVEEVVTDKKKRQRRRTTQICTFNFKRFVARKRWKMSYNKIRAMNMIAKMGLKPPPGFLIEIPPMPDVIDVKSISTEVSSQTGKERKEKRHTSSINRRKHKQHSAPKAGETSESLMLKKMEIDIGDNNTTNTTTSDYNNTITPTTEDIVISDHEEQQTSPVSEPKDYATMSLREKRRARGQLRHDEIVKSKEEITAKKAKPEDNISQDDINNISQDDINNISQDDINNVSQDDINNVSQDDIHNISQDDITLPQTVEEIGSSTMVAEHKPVARIPSAGILKTSQRKDSAGTSEPTKVPHGILKHPQRSIDVPDEAMDVDTKELKPMDIKVQPVVDTGIEDIAVENSANELVEPKGKLIKLEDKLAKTSGSTVDKPETHMDNTATIADKTRLVVDQPATLVDKPGTTVDKPGSTVDKAETPVDKPGTIVNKVKKGGEKPSKVSEKMGKFGDKHGKIGKFVDKPGKFNNKTSAKFGEKRVVKEREDEKIDKEQKTSKQEDKPAEDVNTSSELSVGSITTPQSSTVEDQLPEVKPDGGQPSEVKVETTKQNVSAEKVDTAPDENKETAVPSKPAPKGVDKPAARLQPASWQKQSKQSQDKPSQKPLQGLSKVSLKTNRFMNNNNNAKASPKTPTSPVARSVKANIFNKNQAIQRKEETADKIIADAQDNGAQLKAVSCDIDLEESSPAEITSKTVLKVQDKPAEITQVKHVEEKPMTVDKKVGEKAGGKVDEKSVKVEKKVEEKLVNVDKKVEKVNHEMQEKVDHKVGDKVSKVDNKKMEEKLVKVDKKVEEKPTKVEDKPKGRSGSFQKNVQKNKVKDNPFAKALKNKEKPNVISVKRIPKSDENSEAMVNGVKSVSKEQLSSEEDDLKSASGHSITELTIPSRDNSIDKGNGYDITLTIGSQDGTRRMSLTKAKLTSSSSSLEGSVSSESALTSVSAVDVTSHARGNTAPSRPIKVNTNGKMTSQSAVDISTKYTTNRDFSVYLKEGGKKSTPYVVKAQPRGNQGITIKRANSPISVTPGKKPAANTTTYVPRRTFGFQAKLVEGPTELVIKPTTESEDGTNNNKRWSQDSNTSDRSESSGSSEGTPSKLDSQGEMVSSTELLVNEQNSVNLSQKIENYTSPVMSPRDSPTAERKWKATLVVPKEYEKTPKGAEVRPTIGKQQKQKVSNIRSKWESK